MDAHGKMSTSAEPINNRSPSPPTSSASTTAVPPSPASPRNTSATTTNTTTAATATASEITLEREPVTSAPMALDHGNMTIEAIEPSFWTADLDCNIATTITSDLKPLGQIRPSPMVPESTTAELTEFSPILEDPDKTAMTETEEPTLQLSCKITVYHLPPLPSPVFSAQKTSIVVTTTPEGTSWTPHPSPPFKPYPINRQHSVITLPLEDGGEVWVYLAGGEDDDGDEDVPLMERSGWGEEKQVVDLWEREMIVMKVEERLPVDVGTGGGELAAVERWVRSRSGSRKEWAGEGRFVAVADSGDEVAEE